MRIETSQPVAGIWTAIDLDNFDDAEDAKACNQIRGEGATELEAVKDLMAQTVEQLEEDLGKAELSLNEAASRAKADASAAYDRGYSAGYRAAVHGDCP